MTDPPAATVDDLEDLAAELDDDDNDPAGDDAQAAAHQPIHYFAGMTQGGPPPYPGKLLVSRFPSGILLIDKTTARAWVYDFDAAGGLYRCRDDAGAPLDDAGRWRAADSDTYEVRAYDPEFGGDTAPGADQNAGDGGGDYEQVPQ